MAAKVFFTIEQGVDNDKVIHRVRTTVGAPVNMSAYTGKLTFKKNYLASANDAKTFSMPVTFSNTGEVRLQISRAVAETFPIGRFVYDVVGTNDAGNTYIRVCEGYVSIDPAVSSTT